MDTDPIDILAPTPPEPVSGTPTTSTPKKAEYELTYNCHTGEFVKPYPNDAAERVASFLYDIGKRYSDCTIENYQIEHPAQNAVVEALLGYCKNGREKVLSGQGIILFGPPGTGKDHLLVAMGRRAAGAGFHPVWKTGMELYSAIRNCIGEHTSETKLIRQYTSPRILILSDPLPPIGALTEFQAGVLLNIIDQRYRSMRATWVTLNVANGKEADERLGAQTMDRLKHGALCLYCNWPSYRKPLPKD